MKIFSLPFLIFLLVVLLGVSLGFPFYGHHRNSGNSINSFGNNWEHGHVQGQNHGNGNSTGLPTGPTPSGLTPSGSSPSSSRGSPPSGTPPPAPTGSSTLLPQ